jgi:hypothetical protein
MHCAVAVILGDLGPEQKQKRETDENVFRPFLVLYNPLINLEKFLSPN